MAGASCGGLARERLAGRELRRADAGDDLEPAGRRLDHHLQHAAALRRAQRAHLARDRRRQHAAAAGVPTVLDQPGEARLVDGIVLGERRMQARDDAPKVGSRVEFAHGCRSPSLRLTSADGAKTLVFGRRALIYQARDPR